MVASRPNSSIRLFYSYSHRDASYKDAMDKSLQLLQANGIFQQWSDHQILPGQSISAKVREEMNQANIIVFLFSVDFIASPECQREWAYAAELASDGRMLFRIPIILRDCAWKEMLKDDDVKALPEDGNPIATYPNSDTAWLRVYEGIKAVADEFRQTFTPKRDFLTEFDKTEFISQSHLKLQDLFVFLHLTPEDYRGADQPLGETTITNRSELLIHRHALIHGPEKAGKTALAKHLYLSLLEDSKPVLFFDLGELNSRPTEALFRDAYHYQFHGDYALWLQQEDKTLVLDNMTSAPRSLHLIDLAKNIFDRIVVTLSSDVFQSYYYDEQRLSEFRPMRIEPLTRSQQESLIRQRLALSDRSQPITHGLIDRIEKHVNSVIISDRLLPRYPFYVLSILQIYEGFMPTDMSITSYGHCYHVLIVANLISSGISQADDDVNACFNFAEHLAFSTYQHREQHPSTPFAFQTFLTEYRDRFVIKDSIISRLKRRPYGIITDDGAFKAEYIYYYFLAKFLSENTTLGKPVVAAMCEYSHREANYLTLLFTIHHTKSNAIIDDILLGTMCTLDVVPPALLNREETRGYVSILAHIPDDILSNSSVEEERGRERATPRALGDGLVDTQQEIQEAGIEDPANGIFKILRNNKIMGQVLRSKHGNLEKSKIEEIVETISESGLRLVNLILQDEDELTRFALYVRDGHPNWDLPRVKQALQWLSFIWTIVNVSEIVKAIDVPEIEDIVATVVERGSSPAYDLIGYFSLLNGADELTGKVRDRLESVYKKHNDVFMRRVLSIGTQHYMNTHRSSTRIEQSICSIIEVPYRPRIVRGSRP